MSGPPLYISAFLLSFLAAVVYTPIVRRFALKRDYIARPKEDRWHKKPTALLGGVSIFTAFLTAWLVMSLLSGSGTAVEAILPLVLGGAGMFALGLIDDMVDIKPQHKLVGQIIIASFLVFFGFQIQWFVSKTANLMVSIFWIVGITNAFNLLDNMDGLAAGVAFLAGLFLFLTRTMIPSVQGDSLATFLILSVFLGSVLGFLIFNFNPASIFMGDSGSLFLGFTLAGLTTKSAGVLSGFGSSSLVILIFIPTLILFIPIVDTTSVSVLRRFFGRPISRGGQDHLSHRIVAIGFSERKAVLILYGFTALSGLLAIAVTMLHFSISLVLISMFLVFSFIFWTHLAKVNVYEESSIVSGTKFTPLLVDVTYKKRLFEVVLDLILIPLAYWISYLLRFEGTAYNLNFSTFLNSLPVVVAIQIFSFFLLGVYRGIWQFVSMRDCIIYVKAVTLGTVLSVLTILVLYRFEAYSRTLFIIYWMILLLLVMASRFSYRLIGEMTARNSVASGKRTLIYGAGAGGQLVLREIEQNQGLGLTVIGFMDDDVRKHNSHLFGYPILGGVEELSRFYEKHQISELIISFKNLDKAAEDELKKKCKLLNISLNHLKISIQ